jgi:hypothetical protein
MGYLSGRWNGWGRWRWIVGGLVLLLCWWSVNWGAVGQAQDWDDSELGDGELNNSAMLNFDFDRQGDLEVFFSTFYPAEIEADELTVEFKV